MKKPLLVLALACGLAILSGCATVGRVRNLSAVKCHDSFAAALASILVAEGESAPTAQRLAGETAAALTSRDFGPRPFLVASPSGTDYTFFVQPKGFSCLLRLYGRRKGFVSYTNNLTYIGTRRLDGCECSE